MKTIPAAVLSASLLVAGIAGAAPQDLASLSWLPGCWAQEGSEPGTIEQWMPLAGGTYLGMSRTIRGGKTATFEFLQIRHDANAQIVYVALPSGQQPTNFTAKSVSSTEVVFENLQHDFPQRIIYRSLSADRLSARIEGVRGGQLKGIDYPMKRVNCERLQGAST